MLYIVATPIGNLKDVTLRTLEVLENSDAIICEDTRRTSLLLKHFNIEKPLLVLNDFNEERGIGQIISKLKSGQNLSLVSDAGTPLISDPGYKLVRECLKEDITVDSLPGPSAVTTALTLSGLPPDKFLFLGYLPEKPGKRQELIKRLKFINDQLPTTFIIFVAPHKLLKTLEDIKSELGDIEVSLAAELTKIHQKVSRKKIGELLTEIKNPKGEYVLMLRLNNT